MREAHNNLLEIIKEYPQHVTEQLLRDPSLPYSAGLVGRRALDNESTPEEFLKKLIEKDQLMVRTAEEMIDIILDVVGFDDEQARIAEERMNCPNESDVLEAEAWADFYNGMAERA